MDTTSKTTVTRGAILASGGAAGNVSTETFIVTITAQDPRDVLFDALDRESSTGYIQGYQIYKAAE